MHFNNYLNKLLKLASHFILESLEAFCLLNTLKVFTAFSKDLLLLIYMAPRTSFMAAVCRNYGSFRTASPTIEAETHLINRRAESKMDRFAQFHDLSD